LQRHFVRLEFLTRPDGSPPPVFGRFEAARPNEMWPGDALHGPVIGGWKTYLFVFIDDHSPPITGHRFGHAEDTVRLAAALRPARASRGVPEAIYVGLRVRVRRCVAAAGLRGAGRQAHAQHAGPVNRRDAGRSRGCSLPSATSSWSRSLARQASPGGGTSLISAS
jgi:transposase InsO family protein